MQVKYVRIFNSCPRSDWQICWKSWMESAPVFEISPTTPYADIIVPTLDTVRTSLLVEMLVMHKKQVIVLEIPATRSDIVITLLSS